MTKGGYRASREELLDLARKYETLLAWRRAHESLGARAERVELRALARAFPGALRELDAAPLEVIAARASQLADAAEGGASEPWMHWMVAYHAVMRVALWLKPRLARRLTRVPARWDAMLASAPPCKLPLDAQFVEAVAHPPDGRLNTVVFATLGAAFDADADDIWEGLFPARRPHRFRRSPRSTVASPSALELSRQEPSSRPEEPTMIQFYGSPASSAGKTHWMLEELAIPYTYVRVNSRDGSTRAPEFLAKNPSGKVPFIEDGDVKLFESMAINLYLAEKYGPALLPAGLNGRALVYQWSFWAITNLQPLLLDAMFHASILPENERNLRTLDHARSEAPRYLEVLAKTLHDRAYLLGDAFGVADINVGSVVNLTGGAGLALDAYPSVRAWMDRLRERPAYRKAAAAG